MKALSATVILCFAMCTCFAQTIKSDLEIENLKGNIDSVVITKYIQLNGTPVVKSFLYLQVLRFNQYGNITQELIYSNVGSNFLQNQPVNPRSEKPTTTIYKYDSSEKLTGKITYWGNGMPWFKKVYINNNINNQRQELMYNINDNTVSSNIIATYNAKGQKTEDDFYDNLTDSVNYKIIYQYENGSLVNQYLYDKGGQKDYNEIWTYDKFNNAISHTKDYLHAKYDVSEKTTYVYKAYDKQLNWLYMEELNEQKMIISIIKRDIFYH